nr:hypothetical protein HK105_008002 [Polyrhizophydium stewartii]
MQLLRRLGQLRRRRLALALAAALVAVVGLAAWSIVEAPQDRQPWSLSRSSAALRVEAGSGALLAARPHCRPTFHYQPELQRCSDAFLAGVARAGPPFAAPPRTSWLPASIGRRFTPVLSSAEQAARSAAVRQRAGAAAWNPIPPALPLASKTSWNALCRKGDPRCPLVWVTHSDACTLGSNRLARIVSGAGIPLAVVGYGFPWKNRWGFRMRMLHDFALTQPEERIIVWSDADDVIITPEASVDSLLRRYQDLVKKFGGPRIFFAAETACYPVGGLWSSFVDPNTLPFAPRKTPFRYLNAGIMIGPAGLIRRLTELAYQHDCFDDQYAFQLAYTAPLKWWRSSRTRELHVASPRDDVAELAPASARTLIGLDYWNSLSLAMYGIPIEHYSLNRTSGSLAYSETASAPLILHQNGPKAEDRNIEVLSKAFGYDYDAKAFQKMRQMGKTYEMRSPIAE